MDEIIRRELLQDLAEYLSKLDPPPEKRILGLHANIGKYWMSDDFDDELPDEFWGFDKDFDV